MIIFLSLEIFFIHVHNFTFMFSILFLKEGSLNSLSCRVLFQSRDLYISVLEISSRICLLFSRICHVPPYYVHPGFHPLHLLTTPSIPCVQLCNLCSPFPPWNAHLDQSKTHLQVLLEPHPKKMVHNFLTFTIFPLSL